MKKIIIISFLAILVSSVYYLLTYEQPKPFDLSPVPMQTPPLDEAKVQEIKKIEDAVIQEIKCQSESTIKMNSTTEVILCKSQEEATAFEGKILIKKNKQAPELLTDTSVQNLYTGLLSVKKIKKDLEITKYFKYTGELFPYLKLNLSCQKECNLKSDPTCVFVKPRGRNIEFIVRKMGDFREKKLSHLFVQDLNSLFENSLKGDMEAEKFFLDTTIALVFKDRLIEVFGKDSAEFFKFIELKNILLELKQFQCL